MWFLADIQQIWDSFQFLSHHLVYHKHAPLPVCWKIVQIAEISIVVGKWRFIVVTQQYHVLLNKVIFLTYNLICLIAELLFARVELP